MGKPTVEQNDWVKDALLPPGHPGLDNYKAVDLNQVAHGDFIDVGQLRKDFNNTTHSAVEAALASGDELDKIAATNWPKDDPQGAFKKLGEVGARITPGELATLKLNVGAIQTDQVALKTAINAMQATAHKYQSAVQQLNRAPNPVGEADPDDDGFFQSHGDLVEHGWDVYNITMQIIFAGAEISTLGGADKIKDMLKLDTTDDKISSINDQIAKHRSVVNGLLDTLKAQANSNRLSAISEYDKDCSVMQDAAKNLQTAIKDYADNIRNFTKKTAKKNAPENPEAKKALNTFAAIIAAAATSKAALEFLNTSTLSPSSFPATLKLLVPLGTPVFSDPGSNQPGRYAGDMAVFQKGKVQNVFHETASTMEALSKGLEHVQRVYAKGAELEKLSKDWSAGMEAFANR